MNISFVRSKFNGSDTITAYVRGIPKTINEDHVNFERIYNMLINQGQTFIDYDELEEMIDQATFVKKAIVNYDRIQIDAGEVLFDGHIVEGLLSDMMVNIVKEGGNVEPWCKFMVKLDANPANHAVNELYEWMHKAKMPITESGNFLAYKKVQMDYTSAHRNADGTKLMNKVGTRVEMPRNKVDDNRENTCSVGLHFCSYSYLNSYISGGRTLLVEINPADVVSIPTDYGYAKGRASGYWITGEIDKPKEDTFRDINIIDQSNKYMYKGRWIDMQ